MERLFIRFVLYMPRFPEQAGPCMPKPQSFCPVFENTGRAGKAKQRAPCPPPPHFPTPSPPTRGARIKPELSFLFDEEPRFEQRQTLRDGRMGTFYIKDYFVEANSKQLHLSQQDPEGTFASRVLPDLFSRLFLWARSFF